MSSNTPTSRAWTVVVAATAITAIGGASVAAAWGTQTASPETSAVTLTERRSLTADDTAASSAATWERLGSRAGEWSPSHTPAADSPFAKAGSVSAAHDVQSASVQSVQSVASVVSAQSAQSPISAQSAQSPISAQSAQSPISAQSAQSPISAQSAQSPISAQSAQSPISAQSAQSPASPDSVDSPDTDA